MRSESSHQRRKQLQHPDGIAATSLPQASPWSEAIPHLDVALDKLPELDRAVCCFIFRKPAVSQDRARPRKNPAAVQKQSQRALEKLARILRGRGVVLTATAVAAA